MAVPMYFVFLMTAFLLEATYLEAVFFLVLSLTLPPSMQRVHITTIISI